MQVSPSLSSLSPCLEHLSLPYVRRVASALESLARLNRLRQLHTHGKIRWGTHSSTQCMRSVNSHQYYDFTLQCECGIASVGCLFRVCFFPCLLCCIATLNRGHVIVTVYCDVPLCVWSVCLCVCGLYACSRLFVCCVSSSQPREGAMAQRDASKSRGD